jgi:hypothetical protein
MASDEKIRHKLNMIFMYMRRVRADQWFRLAPQ